MLNMLNNIFEDIIKFKTKTLLEKVTWRFISFFLQHSLSQIIFENNENVFHVCISCITNAFAMDKRKCFIKGECYFCKQVLMLGFCLSILNLNFIPNHDVFY